MTSFFRQRILNSTDGEQRAFLESFYALPFESQRKYVLDSFAKAVTQFQDKTIWPKDPWRHQKNSIVAGYNHLSKPQKPSNLISKIPTAGGKTSIFLSEIFATAQLINGEYITPPTVILVPLEGLATDFYEKIKLQFPTLRVGRYDNVVKDIQPLTVMEYPTWMNLYDDGRISLGDVCHLTLDEAHRALSDPRFSSFGELIGNTVINAFTATPEFDETRSLYELLGRENVVIEVPNQDLIDDGVTAPVKNFVMRLDLEFDETKLSKKQKDFVLQSVRMDTAYKVLTGFEDPETGIKIAGKSSLVFWNTVKQSETAAKYFNRKFGSANPEIQMEWNKFPIFAKSITSKDGRIEVNNSVEELRQEQLAIGCNVGVIREGKDIPPLSIIVDAIGMGSVVTKIQTSGRANRTTEKYPDKTAYVFDFITYVNGKKYNDPIFYFQAIEDQSVLRGTSEVNINIDLDRFIKSLNEEDKNYFESLKDGEAPSQEEVIKEELPKDSRARLRGKRRGFIEDIIEVSNINIEVGKEEPIEKKPSNKGSFLQGLSFTFKTSLDDKEFFLKKVKEGSFIKKSPEWLNQVDFASLYGHKKTPYVITAFFDIIKSNYELNAKRGSEVLTLDIKYEEQTYKIKATNIYTDGIGGYVFSLHESSKPLLDKFMERQLPENWVSLQDAEDVVGISLYKRMAKIEPTKFYNKGGFEVDKDAPNAVLGSELVKKKPNSLNEFMLSLDLVNEWKKVDDHRKRLVSEGYITLSEFEEKSGLSVRAYIEPKLTRLVKESGKEFNIYGSNPSGTEEKFFGADLAWQDQYAKVILVNPKFFEAIKKVDITEKELLAKGYKNTKEVAEHIEKLPKEAEYIIAQTTKDEGNIEGFWKNPISNKLLLSPKLCDALKEQIIARNASKEGMLSISEAVEASGLSSSQISARITSIKDDKEYVIGDRKILGADLCVVDAHKRFVSQELVMDWKSDYEEGKKLMDNAGYKNLATLEKELETHRSTISRVAKKHEGVWYSKYAQSTQDGVLISPETVEQLKARFAVTKKYVKQIKPYDGKE